MVVSVRSGATKFSTGSPGNQSITSPFILSFHFVSFYFFIIYITPINHPVPIENYGDFLSFFWTRLTTKNWCKKKVWRWRKFINTFHSIHLQYRSHSLTYLILNRSHSQNARSFPLTHTLSYSTTPPQKKKKNSKEKPQIHSNISLHTGRELFF